jgi:hypothetical protein
MLDKAMPRGLSALAWANALLAALHGAFADFDWDVVVVAPLRFMSKEDS